MLTWPPQLHLSAPCGMCVWGMVQNSQWCGCGCRHMSLCLITHGCALQSMPSCHRGAAPTEGMHLREGAIEVVTPSELKAAEAGVLGEWQCGQQAHQLVVSQIPAAGVREYREEGAGSVQGAGGWQSVVVLQQGLAGHTTHHPPPPPSSYRTVNFVIADSVAGTVPTMLLTSKSLQCTAPITHRPPARRGSVPANSRQCEECQFGGSEVPPSLMRLTYMSVMCPSVQWIAPP